MPFLATWQPYKSPHITGGDLGEGFRVKSCVGAQYIVPNPVMLIRLGTQHAASD